MFYNKCEESCQRPQNVHNPTNVSKAGPKAAKIDVKSSKDVPEAPKRPAAPPRILTNKLPKLVGPGTQNDTQKQLKIIKK